jgi:methyl-accepting chemotaxis protein
VQRNFILTGNAHYLGEYSQGPDVFYKRLATLRELTANMPAYQERLDALELLGKEKIARLDKGLSIKKDQGHEKVVAFLSETGAAASMQEFEKVKNDMQYAEKEKIDKRLVEIAAASKKNTGVVIYGLLTSLACFTFFGFFLVKNLSVPLRQITITAERIADGDLSGSISSEDTFAGVSDRQDEVGLLCRSFDKMTGYLKEMSGVAENIASNNLSVPFKPVSEKDVLGNAFVVMIDNLKAMTKEIQEGVNMLASSSSQILSLTTQVAASSAETATATSETTTTMEEVKQTSRQMSCRAAAVSETAQSAAGVSETGRKSVEDTISGMGKIKEQMDVVANNIVKLSEQSQAIGAIVSTVSDIANQSNLLAVNASIEAAKAGEHGKGFAVVAQEVRSLAEQSKDATNQVRTILNDIQKAISRAVMATEQGAKMVDAGLKQSLTAGDAIGKMAEGIMTSAQAAMQISVSTNEQVVGIEQVSSAMENIKKATEQIVSGTRQSEESTKNLYELGMKLKRMVERFRI